jgi:tRNA(adenine34) deaminase
VNNDVENMKLALIEAKKGGQNDEVPIGCLIVAESGSVLAATWNKTITNNDPTAHAEMLAIRKAADVIGNYRLNGASLYVTIEPCIMCMGAIIHARISRVIFGAYDVKWGAAGSIYNFAENKQLNHSPEIVPGICMEESRKLMVDFFRSKRDS